MKSLADRVVSRLKKKKDKTKERYTFFISKDIKRAFGRWCAANEIKESPALETMLREMIPEQYYEKS